MSHTFGPSFKVNYPRSGQNKGTIPHLHPTPVQTDGFLHEAILHDMSLSKSIIVCELLARARKRTPCTHRAHTVFACSVSARERGSLVRVTGRCARYACGGSLVTFSSATRARLAGPNLRPDGPIVCAAVGTALNPTSEDSTFKTASTF